MDHLKSKNNTMAFATISVLMLTLSFYFVVADGVTIGKSTPLPNHPNQQQQSNSSSHEQENKVGGDSQPVTQVNCSLPQNVNSSSCHQKFGDNTDGTGMVNYFLKKMSSNKGMLFRTMYVLLAVTGVVVVYFAVKAIRLRRGRSKSRKYGLISKRGDNRDMEMEPLGDGMDDDDDYTVFEMGRRK